jgi:Na+/phosphate symporter
VNKRNIPDIEDLKKNVRENFKKMRVILKNKKNCAKKKKNWERVISENAPKNEKLVLYGLNIEKIFKRNDELIEDLKKNLDENLKEYENKVSGSHSQNINMQKENLMLNEKLKKTVEKLARLENELKVKDKELINYLKRIENDEISLSNLKKEINDRNIQIAKLIIEIEQKDRHLEIIIDKEKFK